MMSAAQHRNARAAAFKAPANRGARRDRDEMYGRLSRPVPATPGVAKEGGAVVLLRRELGDVLRTVRLSQGRTLRDVSAQARVSLGYLSEIERGQKEASSELLASVSTALNVPLWLVLREVSERIALAEGVLIPDTVPQELLASCAGRDGSSLASV